MCRKMGEMLYLEGDRLKTFKNWPIEYIRPEDLAAAGFYYCPLSTPSSKTDIVYFALQEFTKNSTIGDDRVRCFACNLEISSWKPGDNPFADHKLAVPNCRFVRLLERVCNK